MKRIDWRELDGKFSIWKNKIVLEKGQGLERNEMERNGSYRIIALKRLDWKELDKQGLNLFGKEGIEENYIRENLISKN